MKMVINEIHLYDLVNIEDPYNLYTTLDFFDEEIMEMNFIENSESIIRFKTKSLQNYDIDLIKARLEGKS
jgi:hypothetical protein